MRRESEEHATRLDGAIVGRSLACMRCGYDVRGLTVGRCCPECGLDIWESVQRVVDPAARGLPLLRDPRGVGNALVWVLLCILLAAVFFLARPIALGLDALNLAGISGFASHTPPSLTMIAGCFLFLGLFSVATLAPPRGGESSGAIARDLWLLGGGLVATGMLVITICLRGLTDGVALVAGRGLAEGTVERMVLQLMMLVAFVVTLDALRGILRVIGERSREFRTARGGRQRIRDMIVAIGGIAIGEVLRVIGAGVGNEAWHAPGTILLWVCTSMLVIGLCFLVVNAAWIRRSLRTPPPSWREVLKLPDDESDAGTGEAGPEDGEAGATGGEVRDASGDQAPRA